ncbi:MAG: tetratricopeptide repeat protein [Pirellulales bacterium]
MNRSRHYVSIQFDSIRSVLAPRRLRAACVAAVSAVLLASAFAAPVAAQAPQFTAKDLLADSISDIKPNHAQVDDAIIKFSLDDLNGALQHLKNAKQLAPEIPPPELLMAKLCFIGANQRMGRDVQRGRAWLERSVAADPGDPEPYSILGEVALSEGRVTDAGVLFAEAQKLADKFADNPKRKQNFQRKSLQGLAVVAQRREKWDLAKAMIDEWIKLDPENAAAHAALAQALFYLNKPSDAYKSFQEADRLQQIVADRNSPPSPMAELNMAALYQRRDKDDKRTGDLIELAVKNHPKDFGVRLKAAQIAMAANLLDIALTQSEAAVKMDENDLTAKLVRGYVARLRDDFPTAEHYFELAHLQSPGNFDASNNLALLLAERPEDAKKNRAYEFAVMNIQRFPINGQSPARFDAMSTFGWVQFKRKVMADAQQALQQVVNSNAVTPDSRYYIASLLEADPKRTDDAIKVLEAAVESELPFVNRTAATRLLAKLKAASGGGSPPRK